MLLAALRRRRKTGKGMYIDVSQQESAVAFMGGELLAYQMTGPGAGAHRQPLPLVRPCNAYPCAGEDRWITIAATNDAEWEALAAAMDATPLADDPRFATADARMEHQDELDAIIAGWTRGQDAFALAERLQAAGRSRRAGAARPRPAGERTLRRARHLRHRRPPAGRPQAIPRPALENERNPRRSALAVAHPRPAQREIFGGLLGLTGDDIDALESGGVIGTKPTGSRII